MKSELIKYLKNHFDYTYNFNLREYTFFVDTLTSRAIRIEPFINKYFGTTWEIFANDLMVTCHE